MGNFKEEFAGEELVIESLKLVWLWYKRKLKEGYRKQEILEDLAESVNIIKMIEVYEIENIRVIKQILEVIEKGDA